MENDKPEANPKFIVQDKDNPKLAKAGGFVAFSGETKVHGAAWDDYDVYDYTERLSHYDKEAYDFYDEANKQWKTNPYAMMVIEWLINEIYGSGIHFEGPGVKECETFFRDDKTIKAIKILTRHAIMYGNGYMGLSVQGKTKLLSTQQVDTRSIRIEWIDPTGAKAEKNLKYIQLSSYTGKSENTTLKKDLFIDFTLKKDPSERYGLSLIRPNIDLLHAMFDIATDIPAAVKRVAYSPVVIKLDLSGYEEPEDKLRVLTEFADMYENNLSAVTNYVIDNKHELDLLGQGGSGATLLPLRDLIEPLMSVLLINFGFPIGFFLQQGANKAVVEEQHAGVMNFIFEIKRMVAEEVNTRIVPLITGNYDTVFQFSVPRIENPLILRRLMIDEYNAGIISKEYYHEQADIVDLGTSFVPIPEAPARKTGYNQAGAKDES